MSDPLEVAKAELVAWAYEAEGVRDSLEATKNIVVAFMRAAIGCPQCGGTNVEEYTQPLGSDSSVTTQGACHAAEHVEIEFLGETIFADPDKCEWRCEVEDRMEGPWDLMTMGTCYVEYEGEGHAGCGWQPRWSAIKGDET